ncbi:MAG: OmpA family protein, partial [Panacagrimonas sp.]
MSRVWRLLLCVSLTACATGERVILLPDASGKTGKILVQRGERQTLLDQPYEQARPGLIGGLGSGQSDKASVDKAFGEALSALPPEPKSYFLYFEGDSDQLTAESLQRAPGILKQIAQWPAAEISIIGHTDTTGERAYNDALSKQRASRVRGAGTQTVLRASPASWRKATAWPCFSFSVMSSPAYL